MLTARHWFLKAHRSRRSATRLALQACSHIPTELRNQRFVARQLTQSSDYPEIAVTVIAVTASSHPVLENNLPRADRKPALVYRGRVMEYCSETSIVLEQNEHMIGNMTRLERAARVINPTFRKH